jgi:predicted nucleic acid-binding protein
LGAINIAEDVIADSSFYICFLDDVDDPNSLSRIINSQNFRFIGGKLVCSEIKESKNCANVESLDEKIVDPTSYNYGEILKPFFGRSELKKGEHESISIAYIHSSNGKNFKLVLDDRQPRMIIKKNFPDLENKLTGTVGFIGLCNYEYKIFSSEEAINILLSIRDSKFRIKDSILLGEIEKIKLGDSDGNSN